MEFEKGTALLLRYCCFSFSKFFFFFWPLAGFAFSPLNFSPLLDGSFYFYFFITSWGSVSYDCNGNGPGLMSLDVR